MEIDKRTQLKQKQKTVVSSGWGDDINNSVGPMEGAGAEDKRIAMYRNMRDELLKEGAKQKTEAQNKKLEELNAKVAQMEAEKQKRDELARLREQQELQQRAAADAKKSTVNKNLLDNIKSFDVEDI